MILAVDWKFRVQIWSEREFKNRVKASFVWWELHLQVFSCLLFALFWYKPYVTLIFASAFLFLWISYKCHVLQGKDDGGYDYDYDDDYNDKDSKYSKYTYGKKDSKDYNSKKYGDSPAPPEFFICNQPYALCTTAPCVFVPGSDNQTVCDCIVQDGYSLGQVPCEERKLVRSSKGKQLLTSNFSFKNSAVNRAMTCKSHTGLAWTNCLDKPCVVDPQNTNQATCTCNVLRSKSFATFGGSCNTDSCSTVLFSGATLVELQQGSEALADFLHLDKSPVENCPSKHYY